MWYVSQAQSSLQQSKSGEVMTFFTVNSIVYLIGWEEIMQNMCDILINKVKVFFQDSNDPFCS